MAPSELKELTEAPSWAAVQSERLRTIRAVLFLGLGLFLITPMVTVTATEHLGGRAHWWVFTLVAYLLEFWSLRQIGRRARRCQADGGDSPSPADAQIALAATYVLVPLAVLCGRSWYAAGDLAWALGAAATCLGVIAWLAWTLKATRSPPTR